MSTPETGTNPRARVMARSRRGLLEGPAATTGRASRARPGRRRKGAQPGNLNQTRHAWAVYWRRRALRPEDRWIAPLLGDYAAGLLSDKGGPEGVTAAEARMVELAALARGCTMLVLAE